MPPIVILTMDSIRLIKTISDKLILKNNNSLLIIIEVLVWQVQLFNQMLLSFYQIHRNNQTVLSNSSRDKIIIILNFNYKKFQWPKQHNLVNSKQFHIQKAKFKLHPKHHLKNKKMFLQLKKLILKTDTKPKVNCNSIQISILLEGKV